MTSSRDKTALITGAASGIGAALCRLYSAKGYHIIGLDRDAQLGAELRLELGSAFDFISFDLGDVTGLEHLAEQLPPIDLLIHSAGISAVGPFAASEMASNRAVLDVNLRAPLLLTNALLRHKGINSGGGIVFIASLSHFVGYPGAAVYAASKDGLSAYARSLSVGLAPRDIHVLRVFPGPTRTPHARKYSPDNSRENRRMPPEVVAQQIERALERKAFRLIPGLSNRLFALLGRLAPGLTEGLLKRSLLDKLERKLV